MTTETQTKPRRPRPAAVILTHSAEARVAHLMATAPEGAIGVKLSTPRRGCSGFFIDGASVLYLVGSTMDWVEDDFTAGFVFNNPNAKGSCGCGESFTV